MKTSPSTADMNRVIALFDGYEEYEDGAATWFKKEGLIMCMHPKLENLKYHTDYNWLMSAWVKFRDLEMHGKKNVPDLLNYQFLKGALERSILNEPIAEAHKALYDAIVWYNSLNKQQ